MDSFDVFALCDPVWFPAAVHLCRGQPKLNVVKIISQMLSYLTEGRYQIHCSSFSIEEWKRSVFSAFRHRLWRSLHYFTYIEPCHLDRDEKRVTYMAILPGPIRRYPITVLLNVPLHLWDFMAKQPNFYSTTSISLHSVGHLDSRVVQHYKWKYAR